MSVELLLLHALPFDGSMWRQQMDILPGSTLAPDLYGLGGTVTEWAAQVLAQARGDRLVVVGCSVGGSCALEIAAAAPDRVAALVLIGTKAVHRPEAGLLATALDTIKAGGMAAAWIRFWEPLFSPATHPAIVVEARKDALSQSPVAIANGVTAFHSRLSRDDIIATFQGPICFVTGADDPAPGPATNDRQSLLARQGRLHVIEACGHYVPMERPAALNATLREVIAEQVSAAR
jgi:pimeloyl-ACP methyl ester carboxylesterase